MLEVKDVSYTYAGKYQTNEVLHGVSCVFEPGQMYAVMGPSGSGKTTLLSLLAGLDLPTSGEIIVDGEPISAIDRDKYRRETVSVIYQSFNLFPLLTALENVAFPIRLIGRDKKEAEKLAKEYISMVIPGEDEILRKRPLMMSGGQQQRVAIARALAAGGTILLADEPTGNLDAANGAAVVEILKKLAHEKNYIVIVITHSEAVAQQADAVYKLADGVIRD